MAQANRPEGLAGGGRGAGGITGAGGRYVNPVYKEVGVQPPIKINTNPVKNTEKKRTLKEMKEFNNFISSLNAKSKAKLDAEIKKLK